MENEIYLTKKNILVGRREWDDVPEDHQENGIILKDRVNRLLKHYYQDLKNEPEDERFYPKINDGYRPPEIKYGSKKSKHRILAAIDMDDNAEGTLWSWIKCNVWLLKHFGLWMEDPRYTHYFDEKGNSKSWCHLQIEPPGSGNRIYIPHSGECPNPEFWDGKYDKLLNGFI